MAETLPKKSLTDQEAIEDVDNALQHFLSIETRCRNFGSTKPDAETISYVLAKIRGEVANQSQPKDKNAICPWEAFIDKAIYLPST